MPTVDEGIELLRAVRAMRDAPPVVVVSGDDTRRREAIAEGAAAFLVKTVGMEDLLKAIFVVLGTRRALHPTKLGLAAVPRRGSRAQLASGNTSWAGSPSRDRSALRRSALERLMRSSA